MPQVASLHLLLHGVTTTLTHFLLKKFRHVHIPEQPHRTEQLQIELGYHISENLLKHNDNFILHGYPFSFLKHNKVKL